MRRLSAAASLAFAALVSSPASAAVYWNVVIEVTATGNKETAYQNPFQIINEPINQTFTFERTFFPFEGSVSLGSSYNNPYSDPLGLSDRPIINGTVTLANGTLTGTDFSYLGSTCRIFTSGCSTYTLRSPTFSVLFASAQGGVGPVPEPSTWALMLLGFGTIGLSLRRKSRAQTTVVLSR